jgi:hypothetical protein
MNYKEGFQQGQIPLEDFRTFHEASLRLTTFWFDEFQKPRYREKKREGYTLGLAHAKHRWHIVLNPPGVSSLK